MLRLSGLVLLGIAAIVAAIVLTTALTLMGLVCVCSHHNCEHRCTPASAPMEPCSKEPQGPPSPN